jgi:very-short-patch-repair endonuclease
MLTYDGKLNQRARELRKNMTDAERLLWSKIRRHQLLGVPFSRQKIIGPYIVDFFCPRAKLVIEVDGSQHYSGEVKKKDKIRDDYLESQGLTVLRFNDNEVLTNIEGVVDRILENLKVSESENPLESPFAKGGK